MKTPNPPDFLVDLLGLKRKADKPTEKQKLGLRLLEIAKQHPKSRNDEN